MAELTIPQAFDLAVRHHLAGRLPQAAGIYRRILAHQPEHAESLNHLGMIANQQGQNDIAIDLIRRAIAIRPHYAEAHNNLGVALKEDGQIDQAIAAWRTALTLNSNLPKTYNNLGRALADKGELDEAITACRRAIALDPDYAEAHFNLGIALMDNKQNDQAITAFRQVIALRSDFASAYSNLGTILSEKGQLDQAIAMWRQAIALNPNLPEAHTNLGIALKDKGQLDEAVTVARQAIALRPNYAEAYSNLGIILKDKLQLDEAIAAYRQAIHIKPNCAHAHTNLGVALKDKGQLDEAVAACRQAIALNPDLPVSHVNLSAVLIDQGRLDEAIAACRQAIAIDPNFPNAHTNLALALLTRGDFPQGWEEYEWRWKGQDFLTPPRHSAQPLWDGRPFQGRTLLLYAERGFGDTLQFIRYLPLVARRGGRIIIECQPALQRFLQPLVGDCQIVAQGQPLPAYDFQCSLLSLPRVFGTTLESIPAILPYPGADTQDADRWRQRLANHSPFIKVGLAWAGNPTHKNDRNRSMKLSMLAPLMQVPEAHFFCLQKGEGANQAQTPPPSMEIVDWTAELKDFADTAALIANLDLVISVDTAVAHLAGAMGKPVWTMLPFVPDWRWLVQREDSPWYPTMRLFRQPSVGDWDSVVARVREEFQNGNPRSAARRG